MAGSSRTALFLSAILLIAAAGGLMSSKGESFLLPIVLMLASAAAVLGYGILSGEKTQSTYSSPIRDTSTQALAEVIDGQEETVDPAEVGFEIPVL